MLIPALIFLLLVSVVSVPALAEEQVAEADKILQDPALDLCAGLKALDLYAARLTRPEPHQVSLMTRLARTCFIIGELTTGSQRQKYYERGQHYADMLLKEAPNRVEGHYWLAMHLCGQADAGGAMLGRRLLPQIMEEMKRAQTINDVYDQAGSHRVLGRIYCEAPSWPFSVGDLQKSLQHLTKAVRLAPQNSTNHLYLAETLIKLRRDEAARRELEQVLKASQHALLLRCLEDDQKEARSLLQRTALADE
ncbi:MAG: tetratricopeptide repeat protein [Desulfobaccales bacterium]